MKGCSVRFLTRSAGLKEKDPKPQVLILAGEQGKNMVELVGSLWVLS